jgi:L-iditol 2-dehydrogenase
MKSAFVKAPYQFEVREVPLKEPGPEDILLKVMSCGVCGTDLSTAASEAKEWQHFGHEAAGIVEKVGARVSDLAVGDEVVLESNSPCGLCEPCRNGRPDLCEHGVNYWLKGPMGFSEYMVLPARCAVRMKGLSFLEAALIEPMGVALDVTYAAEVKLGDDVLVLGCGPIGLMAIQLAKLSGARRIYAGDVSKATRRLELARKFGADEVIEVDGQDLRKELFEKGGLDKAIVTAPPSTIPSVLKVMNYSGVVGFIGIEFGPKATISFDANEFHFRKLSLRASFASPAMYFPRCIDMVRSGRVDLKSLVSGTFALGDIEKAMKGLRDDKANSLKGVMLAKG